MCSVTSTEAALRAPEQFSLGQVLRAWLKNREEDLPGLPPHHWKVIGRLAACRTPEMGGHVYRCKECGRDHFVPHSCRDRHCPGCQPMRGFDWMQAQVESLLPVPYFHVVFTLPHELNPLIAQNQAALYKLLFDTASSILLEFGRNRFKAQIGVTTVLHTWSQNLGDHYHLHCIVTGGGLRLDGSGWAKCPKHYLFPVKALSKKFRGKYRAGLQRLFDAGELEFHGKMEASRPPGAFRKLLWRACREKWVVYAKRPFAGPEQVIAYLARYTHRVGITNSRIKNLDEAANQVTFQYKDYADKNRHKQMTLSLDEFVRRFRLHILPARFVKIRHYGLLSNRTRSEKVAEARKALGVESSQLAELLARANESRDPPGPKCPHCQSGNVRLIQVILPPWRIARAPP
jgi:hypothetical protein